MADYLAAMVRRLNRHIVWAPDDLAIGAAITQALTTDASIIQPDGTVQSSSAWLQSLENQLMLNNAYFYTGLHWRTLGDPGGPTYPPPTVDELGLVTLTDTLGLINPSDTLQVLQ